jgi:hypothetical protein
MNDYNKPEYLDNTDPEKNLDYYRQDHGGMITNHNGVADKLLQNNDLYRSMKGDWSRTETNKSGNIIVTTGREDGKFYIKREQQNAKAIAEACKNYRHAAEKGIPDPLAPIGDDGKLTWKWMDLPQVVAIRISDETEYPMYVCYPGGKLPIPVDVPYPTKKGQKRFFEGH